MTTPLLAQIAWKHLLRTDRRAQFSIYEEVILLRHGRRAWHDKALVAALTEQINLN